MIARIDRLPQRLFTVEEYECIGATGVLNNERVELIEGRILDIAPIGSRHASVVDTFAELLLPALVGRARVRIQQPLRLPPASEPQPDLVVARRRADGYKDSHPDPADVLLVIEVSDTTLRYDRDIKLSLYAKAGIPEAWIADLSGRRLLVHRSRRDGRYEEVLSLRLRDTVSPLAFPDLTLRVSELFT